MFCLSTKEKEKKIAWKQMIVKNLYERQKNTSAILFWMLGTFLLLSPSFLAFTRFRAGSSVGNATWLVLLRHSLAFTRILRAGQRTSGIRGNNCWFHWTHQNILVFAFIWIFMKDFVQTRYEDRWIHLNIYEVIWFKLDMRIDAFI